MINDATKFRHPVDWKLRLLDILVSFFGDSDASKITVLELGPAGQVGCCEDEQKNTHTRQIHASKDTQKDKDT